MRFESGDATQYLHFVAVDATDLKTRETGLTTFTVYSVRGNGTPLLWTTPTITESEATNMPGAYELLLDESVDVTEGLMTERVVYHITQADMAPVTIDAEWFVIPGVYRDSNDDYKAVLTGVGASSATLAAITAGTDALAGCVLEIIAGTGAGQARLITTNTNAANPVCTLDRAWETQPTVATYRLWLGSLPSTTTELADAVHDEPLAGHSTAGSAGKALSDADANVVDIQGRLPAALNAAGLVRAGVEQVNDEDIAGDGKSTPFYVP